MAADKMIKYAQKKAVLMYAVGDAIRVNARAFKVPAESKIRISGRGRRLSRPTALASVFAGCGGLLRSGLSARATTHGS